PRTAARSRPGHPAGPTGTPSTTSCFGSPNCWAIRPDMAPGLGIGADWVRQEMAERNLNPLFGRSGVAYLPLWRRIGVRQKSRTSAFSPAVSVAKSGDPGPGVIQGPPWSPRSDLHATDFP